MIIAVNSNYSDIFIDTYIRTLSEMKHNKEQDYQLEVEQTSSSEEKDKISNRTKDVNNAMYGVNAEYFNLIDYYV